MSTAKLPLLLIAEDDPEDRMLMADAMEECQWLGPSAFVEDGEELMNYLNRVEPYAHLRDENLPGLILLDLNMPRKDGREALEEIKADPRLETIPIVVFSTSRAEEDIHTTYQLGVNSFITKPANFANLVDMMKTIKKYWLEIVELP
ncbi:response regulator [Pontibacter sp. G13]|uniref:response regulator n=1 Tax=Pontibacter sp. G13 TaxID=3074898 RepID=UPI00288BA882|nr:response regulator [Pontibacter sp. G13]WNJ17774.1 response regulator [Pontibacter sp. G13]